MNHKVSFALCLCMAAVVTSWTTWFSFASAQDAELTPLRDLTQTPVRGSTVGNAAVYPTLNSRTQPQPVPPAAGVLQYVPSSIYYGPAYGVNQSASATTVTDPRTAEAISAYHKLQNEIGGLLQRRLNAKDEPEGSALRKQLVDATAAQFDLQQQQRERQIEELKERLESVEKNFASRSKLKDEIVEKRVADILREPNQLQWESLSIATAPNGAAILPPSGFSPSALTPSYGSIPAPPAKTYVPRTTTRVQRDTIVNDNGTTTVVETPVTETEYVEAEPTRVVPIPDASSLSSRLAMPLVSTTAFGHQRQVAPASLSVAEAAASVRFFEAKRDQLRWKSGDNIDRTELKSLDAELELAKLIHARSQVEYEGRTKLLELDVRQAESVYELEKTDLTRTQELDGRAPNTIPSTQIAKQEAAVEQARIQMERAKTMLEIHQKSNAPQAEQPLVPAR